MQPMVGEMFKVVGNALWVWKQGGAFALPKGVTMVVIRPSEKGDEPNRVWVATSVGQVCSALLTFYVERLE